MTGKYDLGNLQFRHMETPGAVMHELVGGKSLFFVKSSLCCLAPTDLDNLLDQAANAGMDVALMKLCSCVLNESSCLMSVSRKTGGHILYSPSLIKTASA